MNEENLVAGIVSGIAQTIIGHPLDTFKVWKQQRLTPVFAHVFKGLKYPLVTGPLITGLQFSAAMEASRRIGLDNRVLADAIGGGASGIVTGLCLAPVDRYKIAKQSVSRMPQYGLMSCFAREIPASAIYFGSYSMLRQSEVPVFAAGSAAGMLSWLLTYPMDIIKTQVQSGESRTIMQAISKMQRGQISSTAGVGFCLARAFITNGVGFVAYEEAMNLIL